MIVSPDSNGDGYYDANANCVWRIEVLEDYVIRYHLEAELYIDCESDVLRVSTQYE